MCVCVCVCVCLTKWLRVEESESLCRRICCGMLNRKVVSESASLSCAAAGSLLSVISVSS